jgi:cytoskeletal protein RodZ
MPHITARQRLATVQSISVPNLKKKDKKHPTTVAIFIMISGIIVLGISITNYAEFFTAFTQSEIKPLAPDHVTSTPVHEKTIPTSQYLSNQNTQTRQQAEQAFTYNNCLGVSDGTHLTVTCPTGYGTPYKAVVKIPTELIIQLESDVFNLREISITEHTDSISIQYAKKMYEAKFLNN